MMTPKKKLFVREYLIDRNATRAATAAGYSEKTAYSSGQRLLKDVEVSTEIDCVTAERCKELEITGKKVLDELAKIGFSNMRTYLKPTADGQFDLDMENATRDDWAPVQEITVDTTGGTGDGERRRVLRTRLKLGDKRGSLELLGKHLKLFTDKVEQTGEGGGPVQTEMTIKFVKPNA
jgi:phage terminase small subunit